MGRAPGPANVTGWLQEFGELRQPDTPENPRERFEIVKECFSKALSVTGPGPAEHLAGDTDLDGLSSMAARRRHPGAALQAA